MEGHKRSQKLVKEENFVKREITIAFRDQKCLQDVTLYPKEKIQAKFTKGIIDGEKIVSLTSKEEKNYSPNILGYQINWNDGDVYWYD